jgi:hypothetical protein
MDESEAKRGWFVRNRKWGLPVFCLIILISVTAGCFRYNEGLRLKENKSYLRLTGNYEDVELQIDENAPVVVAKDAPYVYEVRPGLHIITVYRNRSIIVERKLLFESNTTLEVDIP